MEPMILMPIRTRNTLRAFFDECPPFRALTTAFFLVQYDRCFRLKGKSYKAGRVDALMCAYLPYCDVFVTDDRKFTAALEVIVPELDISAP
jgi:hypothetical protein